MMDERVVVENVASVELVDRAFFKLLNLIE